MEREKNRGKECQRNKQRKCVCVYDRQTDQQTDRQTDRERVHISLIIILTPWEQNFLSICWQYAIDSIYDFGFGN